MSPAGAHHKQRGFFRIEQFASTGRHAAPSPLANAARRAGRIVPAAALAGALITAPHVVHLATASPSHLASDIAAAHGVGAHHVRHQGVTVKEPSHVASPADAADPAGKAKTPGKVPATVTPAPRQRPKPRPQRRPSRGQKSKPKPTSATPTAKATPTPTQTGPVCDGTAGLLPANYPAIVTFLMSHGYTGIAAAGIAGNIYQESKGNPESVGTGGGGLIGWTPLPSGFVTGDPAADLKTQLNALLTYNDQWSQYLPALNAETSAVQAAYLYMTDFERPGIPAASNRETAAADVAAACHL